MEYIICAFIILFTFVIMYNINGYLDNSFKLKSKEDLKFNILSDYIIVLSKQNCPYCVELEEKISKTNKQHTVITLTDEMTFNFDDTFTNLKEEERNSIITEIQKILIPGQEVLFPTIITQDNTYTGLPKEEIITEIFNI